MELKLDDFKNLLLENYTLRREIADLQVALSAAQDQLLTADDRKNGKVISHTLEQKVEG